MSLPPLPVRIISRLDVKKPNVVKGINLEGLRIIGSPEELALKYQQQGADELVFIDCVASLYQRNTVFDVIENVAERLRIPFTVGGGIDSVDSMSTLLYKGADKVLMNTAAVKNPELIEEAARKFGSQCVVISIEAKLDSRAGKWLVYIDNGRENTGIDVCEWIQEIEKLAAGEIFLTSVDRDGMQKGFDLDLCRSVMELVRIPVVVSGGAGTTEHVVEVVKSCRPGGVALGALFHYKKATVGQVKTALADQGVAVRPF